MKRIVVLVAASLGALLAGVVMAWAWLHGATKCPLGLQPVKICVEHAFADWEPLVAVAAISLAMIGFAIAVTRDRLHRG